MSGKKIALVVAGVMMVVGVGLGVAAFASSGFEVDNMLVEGEEGQYMEKTYPIEESFKNITVENSQVTILPSKDDKARVDTVETKNFHYEINVSGDTLKVSGISETTNWFDYILNVKSPEAFVYLPESEYERLFIKNNSGNTTVEEGFVFAEVDIRTTSGNTRFDSNVKGDLSIDSSSGNVSSTAESAANASIKSTSGNLIVSGLSAKDVDIEAKSGVVTVEKITCDRLSVDATSGNIKVSDITATDVTATNSSGNLSVSSVTADNLKVNGRSGNSTISECVIALGIDVERSSGVVKLKDTTSGKTMNISSTSGSITLQGCDSQDIKIEAHSGIISAELLSAKNIDASSKSGIISLPDESGEKNGTLYIRSTSGTIKVSYR